MEGPKSGCERREQGSNDADFDSGAFVTVSFIILGYIKMESRRDQRRGMEGL